MAEIDDLFEFCRENEAHWTEQERNWMLDVVLPVERPADATFIRMLAIDVKGRIEMAKKSKAKQAPLIDVVHPSHKHLVKLADQYVEKRDERQAILSEEVDLKKRLLDAMHEAKLEEFKCDECEIRVVKEDETVKVRKIKKHEGDSDAD